MGYCKERNLLPTRCLLVLLLLSLSSSQSKVEDSDKTPALIIGAMKSGTSGLFDALLSHPSFHHAKLHKNRMPWQSKELHFFDVTYDSKKMSSENALSMYLNKFNSSPKGHLNLEATPNYFHAWNKVPRNILNVFGADRASRLKFVLILRNPVERALSHWRFAKNRSVEFNKQLRNDTNIISSIRIDPNQDKEALKEKCIQNKGDKAGDGVVPGCWSMRMSHQQKETENLTSTCVSLINEFEACTASCSDTSKGNNRLKCEDKCSLGNPLKGLIARGLYNIALRHWLTHFNETQFCIVSFEKFADREGFSETMNIVSQFLLDSPNVQHEWEPPEKKNPMLEEWVPGGSSETGRQDFKEAADIIGTFYRKRGRSSFYEELKTRGTFGCGSEEKFRQFI
eukprot:m.83717 g.83717  ORF g.83717 m.83717 type:complete len:397 (+) comp12932_c0_seq2:116-1306(+)